MKLDVKNLVFGAVGEKKEFSFNQNEYKLTDEIFAHDLKGEVKLTRLEESVLAEIGGDAEIGLVCDRCLGNYQAKMTFSFVLEYFLGGYRENQEDLLVSRQFDIDIEEPLREEILLALPVKRLCCKDCRGLCHRCGTNLNLDDCVCSNDDSS